MLVLGIDAGSKGAFAVIDAETNAVVSIDDMPTWKKSVGKSGKKQTRIDYITLRGMFETYKMMGVKLAVLERVWALPGNGAREAFSYGMNVGYLLCTLLDSRIPFEDPTAANWKKLLEVPGKSKGTPADIVARAEQIFPDASPMFRGPRGGLKLDRAEAAMLGYFGVKYVLPNTALSDKQTVWDEICKRAELTG